MTGLPYVLVDVHDFIETLSEFGIEYDNESFKEDVHVIKKASNGSTYSKLADLDIHIFDLANYKTMLIPVFDKAQYGDYDFHEMRKVYFQNLLRTKEAPEIVAIFKETADRLLDPAIFKVVVPARKFEDILDDIPAKKGFETIHITSYIISEESNQKEKLEYDARIVFALCNQLISDKHVMDSLKPSKNKNILVTIFQNARHDIVGIRTTKLISGKKADIMGSFACSNGYGMILQQHTENLIRTYEGMFFPRQVSNKKPVTYRLWAIPSAQGFWKRVGFEATEKKDETGNVLFEKMLYPDNEISVATNKRKKSTSPGVTSKKRGV